MLTSAARAARAAGDRVGRGEERRPHDRRADRPGRLRVAGAVVGSNRWGLSPRPSSAVVVGELDVAIEGDRSQVGEVVEPVALEPRTEVDLCGDADGEERGEDQRRSVPPSLPARPPAPRPTRRWRPTSAPRPGRSPIRDSSSDRRATSRVQSSRLMAASSDHTTARMMITAPLSGSAARARDAARRDVKRASSSACENSVMYCVYSSRNSRGRSRYGP